MKIYFDNLNHTVEFINSIYNISIAVIYDNPFIINIFKNNIYTNTDYNMIENLIEKYNYVFVYNMENKLYDKYSYNDNLINLVFHKNILCDYIYPIKSEKYIMENYPIFSEKAVREKVYIAIKEKKLLKINYNHIEVLDY